MLDGFFRKWGMDRPQARVSESNTLVDLSERLRVSEPQTLLNSAHTLGKSPMTFDEVLGGGGTSTWIQADISVAMAVSANNDYVIRQTRTSFNYQASKPLKFEGTGILPVKSGITSRIGMFHSGFVAPYAPVDGVMFESINGVMYVSTMKNGVYTTHVPQSEWNCDRLDGNGPSGLTADWDKFFLFLIDYKWLGGANVRWAVMIDGAPVVVHVAKHSGVVSNTYMLTGTQPVRYEIRSTGGSATMINQCCSVLSEGAQLGIGIAGAIDNGINAISVGVGATRLISAVRIAPTEIARHHVVDLISYYMSNSAANTSYYYMLLWNPTIGGTPNWVVFPNSSVETWTGTGAEEVTLGFHMEAGYGDTKTSNIITAEMKSALGLGINITGTSNVIALAVTGMTGTSAMSGGVRCRQSL